MWTFMRRAKIAGRGFSTDFLANVAPALIQDMTAPSAGTALSSAFQAFVIGAKDTASKVNLAEQERIGIRKDGKLFNSQLMGENPYEWAKQILLPALQKDKVNIDNDTALAESIAKFTRNSPAGAMLTKMLQQRQQNDRLIEQYRNAKGLDAANDATAKDPFVAWKGFTESWRELATAIKGMPEAVAGLNMLTGGIQRFATALRDKDGLAQAGLAGAGALGAFAVWKTAAAIYGLVTAGTNLNAAAVALEVAAAKLGGASAVGDVADVAKKKGPGAWSAALAVLGRMAPNAAMLMLGGSTSHNAYANAAADERQRQRDKAIAEADFQNRYGIPSTLAQLANRTGSPDDRDERFRAINPYASALEAVARRQQMEGYTTPYDPNTPGVSRYFDQPARPDVDMTKADDALTRAGQVGTGIMDALSVSAKPAVDTSDLERAARLVRKIKSGLSGLGGLMQSAHNSVAREMHRNFADFGVKP